MTFSGWIWSDLGELALASLLGGGAIIKAGVTIQGLTTAAAIWCSAAIGMAAGARMPIHALALTALALLALVAFEPLESVLTRRRDLRRIVVDATSGLELVDRLRALLPSLGLRLQSVGVKQQMDAGRIRVTITVNYPEDVSPVTLLSELERLPGVLDVELE